eukprot:TRINITY_DN269_c0_g1_i3.p1 TRINITY_DN269_c0_g1~~TRINITY_DN269_c0_g1_i3.p1  ORF type:complete len:375 (+),score=135.66 TRINITY_DN269_c0_g1_i3:126-1250(+)
MIKSRPLDVSATNIANLGSDLEKNCRLAASNSEKSWDEAGKKVGLQIWRIEKFHVKDVPANTYGTFYNGDSYIVLHTYKKDPAAANFSYDVFFWLGKFTSQDEYGTAAYKTVELDDHLHGLPVEYREVDGFESDRFLSLFPKGLRVLEGGIDSGFHHVKPEEYRPRLLQIKGRKHIRVTEVPLSYQSLNSGDVFVLDAGITIYQWIGSSASGSEKTKASMLSQALEEERNGKSHNVVVDEGKDDAEFFKVLGGKGPIASAAAGGSDADAEKGASKSIKLFRLREEAPPSGKFSFSQVGEGDKLKKSDVSSDDVFILDTGAEVIVWVGQKASAGEKKKGLQYAIDYLAENKRPPQTPISRVLEGGENEVWGHYVH